MALHFGVIPQETANPDDPREFVRMVDDLVRAQRFAAGGDRIIIVAGSSLGTPSMLNGVLIHTVGEDREEHLSDGAEAMVETEESTS
jgi:hypothetical protein